MSDLMYFQWPQTSSGTQFVLIVVITYMCTGNVESKSKRNILQSDLVVSHCDIRNESTKEKGKGKKETYFYYKIQEIISLLRN